MDLEKLNKSQIVLLTLLVSFVTSIATGIVTVALMEQAPQAITQTVNRVVERTIEKVAAADAQTASAAVATVPVIIRESDLLATAIETVSPSVVRLYAPGKDENGNDTQLFIGLAVVTDKDGILIADAGTPDGAITAIRFDGVEVPATVIERPAGANIIRLKVATTTGDGEKKEAVSWTPATLASKDVVLGRAVVAIGGRASTKIAKGVITAISGSEGNTMKGLIETDIAAASFEPGSPLIDSDGRVVAIATRESRTMATGGFLASDSIVLQNKPTEGGQGSNTAP